MSVIVACISILICGDVKAEENIESGTMVNVETEVESTVNPGESNIATEFDVDERIIPQYSASYTDSFDVGSTYVQVTIWIDANQGGVTLTSSDYCDFAEVNCYGEKIENDAMSSRINQHNNSTCCIVCIL